MKRETLVQITLATIGIVIFMIGSGGIAKDPATLSQGQTLLQYQLYSFGFVIVGFVLFFFGLFYPYLEAWKKRKLGQTYDLLAKHKI